MQDSARDLGENFSVWLKRGVKKELLSVFTLTGPVVHRRTAQWPQRVSDKELHKTDPLSQAPQTVKPELRNGRMAGAERAQYGPQSVSTGLRNGRL